MVGCHSTPAGSLAIADTSLQPIPPVPSIGEHLELVEDDSCEQTELVRPSPSTPSTHRYPSRTRRPYLAIVTLSHIHDKMGRLLQEGG